MVAFPARVNDMGEFRGMGPKFGPRAAPEPPPMETMFESSA
jgi:hypothetical protein